MSLCPDVAELGTPITLITGPKSVFAILDNPPPIKHNSPRRIKSESKPDRLRGSSLVQAPVFPEIYEDFMSSAVISTSAASGRPFIFDAESQPEVCPIVCPKKPAGAQGPQESPIARLFQSSIKNQQSTIALITPASQLGIRPAPEMASSGIPDLDALTGGLPRGCLTELCGPASSGRTTVLLAALAAATRRGEYCALIDASDALDPHSAAAAGIDLDRLLWVRCSDSPQKHRATDNHKTTINNSARYSVLATRNSLHCLEQVLRATDLLLESGGLGLIVLDLADLPMQAARRIPLTTWFRFRRAVEHKPTILLAIEQYPIAGSCSSLLLQLGVVSSQYLVLSDQAEGHTTQDLPEI